MVLTSAAGSPDETAASGSLARTAESSPIKTNLPWADFNFGLTDEQRAFQQTHPADRRNILQMMQAQQTPDFDTYLRIHRTQNILDQARKAEGRPSPYKRGPQPWINPQDRTMIMPHVTAALEDDYAMRHRPVGDESDAIHRDDGNAGDFVQHPENWGVDTSKRATLLPTNPTREQLYSWRHRVAELQSWVAVAQSQGNPDAPTKIYRAVPHGIDRINPDDWVALSPMYANLHAESSQCPDCGKPLQILRAEVPAKYVRFDSPSEYGFHGPEPVASTGRVMRKHPRPKPGWLSDDQAAAWDQRPDVIKRRSSYWWEYTSANTDDGWDWEEAPPGRGGSDDYPDDDIAKTAAGEGDWGVGDWQDLGQMRDINGKVYNVRFRTRSHSGAYEGQAVDPAVNHQEEERDPDEDAGINDPRMGDDHEAVVRWHHNGKITWRGAKASHRGSYLSILLKQHLADNVPDNVNAPYHSNDLTQHGRASLERYLADYGDPHGDIREALGIHSEEDEPDWSEYYQPMTHEAASSDDDDVNADLSFNVDPEYFEGLDAFQRQLRREREEYRDSPHRGEGPVQVDFVPDPIHKLNAAEVQHQGDSPLNYSSVWSGPQPERLAVVDHEAGEPRPREPYFAPDSSDPAAPGTVAFLDYSKWNPDSVYVNYMASRRDQQKQGHQRKLVEALLARHPEVSNIDFGEEMEPQVTHLRQSLQKEHPDKYFRGKVRHYGAAEPQLQVQEFEGERGNNSHITRNEQGLVPIDWVRNLMGARGERPGEHRNYQGDQWEDFKQAVANGEPGYSEPIFITVDHNGIAKINEGNHRRDAYVENGATHVPVYVRYFGHAEKQGTLGQRVGMQREAMPRDDGFLRSLRYDVSSHVQPGYPNDGFHRIKAWHPDGSDAGYIEWDAFDGKILDAAVAGRLQRKGLGTELLNRAYHHSINNGLEPPDHDWDNLSDDAKDWITGMGQDPGEDDYGYDEFHRGWKRRAAVDVIESEPQYNSDEDYDTNAARRRDWKQSIRHGLSMGHVTPEQAQAVGYSGSGHDQGGRTGLKWQPLPSTLYHVTTDLPGVMQHGIKSRDELAQDRGKGLGGGESDTISYTDDPATAQRIHEALHEFHGVLNGKKTMREMYEEAKAGHGAEKPWDSMLRNVEYGSGAGDDDPGLQANLEGRKYQWHGLPYTQAEIDEKFPGAGWEPHPTATTWDSPRGTVYNAWHRPMTEDEKRDKLASFYKTWAAGRMHAGGPEDPMFFSTDLKGFAAMDPKNFGIVRAHPHPGAQGYPVSALGEWRTTTGQNVDVDPQPFSLHREANAMWREANALATPYTEVLEKVALRQAATDPRRKRIEDMIDQWHDAKPGSPAASMELHEWLGMTPEEYQRHIIDGEKLPKKEAAYGDHRYILPDDYYHERLPDEERQQKYLEDTEGDPHNFWSENGVDPAWGEHGPHPGYTDEQAINIIKNSGPLYHASEVPPEEMGPEIDWRKGKRNSFTGMSGYRNFFTNDKEFARRYYGRYIYQVEPTNWEDVESDPHGGMMGLHDGDPSLGHAAVTAENGGHLSMQAYHPLRVLGVEDTGPGEMRHRASTNADESGLKAAGIAVIAMDTGRVLMLQRALNPVTCPCGIPVAWDEQNGWQHEDGSVSHDNEFYGQSVSDLLDQGHHETCPECGGTGEDGDGHECTPCDGSGVDPDKSLLKTAMPRDEDYLNNLSYEFTPNAPIWGGVDHEHQLGAYDYDGAEHGFLRWNPETGVIKNIDTVDNGVRQGLGTELLRRAKEISRKNGYPELRHSYILTEDGKDFVRGLGDQRGGPVLQAEGSADDDPELAERYRQHWNNVIDYSDDAAMGLNPEDDWVHANAYGKKFLYRRGRDDGEHHFIMEPNEHTPYWYYFNTKGHPRKGFVRPDHAMDYGNFLVDDDDYELGQGRTLPPHEAALEFDKNEGVWEFPGGTLEDGENPRDAAVREFAEEVGQGLPPGVFVGAWLSPSGTEQPVYKGFIYLVQNERDIDLAGARNHINPDDPDGDMTEQCAWWDIEDAKNNPALRPECKTTPWDEFEIWADKSVRSNREVVAMVQKMAMGLDRHDENSLAYLDRFGPDSVYLRFGDWPHNERSMNHITGIPEYGVSVYELNKNGDPVDPDSAMNRGIHQHSVSCGDPDEYGDYECGMGEGEHQDPDYMDDTYDMLRGHLGDARRGHNLPGSRRAAHLVKGELAGFGHDDEPLLHNVQKVGHWPCDVHKFIPGLPKTPDGGFSHEGRWENGKVNWCEHPDHDEDLDEMQHEATVKTAVKGVQGRPPKSTPVGAPDEKVYPALRDLIAAGRPEYSIRTSAEVPVDKHDRIMETPNYYESQEYDPHAGQVYARRSKSNFTFLAPVRHNQTGELGWLRGNNGQDPAAWRYHPEDKFESALRAAPPAGDLAPGEKRPVGRPRVRPVGEPRKVYDKAPNRYTRGYAKGTPDAGDWVAQEHQLQQPQEGDVPLDEEGHQLDVDMSLPRTWTDLGHLRGFAEDAPEEDEDKPWEQRDWKGLPEPDFVKYPERHLPRSVASVEHQWWEFAD